MLHSHRNVNSKLFGACAIAILGCLASGCATSSNDTTYDRWRSEAQDAMHRGDYAVARSLLLSAENKHARDPVTLHNLGVCSLHVAMAKSQEMNYAAAMRELDVAEAYFRRAIDASPAFQPSQEGLNESLELKGEYAMALKEAEWAATNVGPSSKEQIFLAGALERQGDVDGALLRYRQAVAMEPKSPVPHVALGIFLKRTGDGAGALAEFQAAQELNPKDQYVAGQIAALNSPTRTPATYDASDTAGLARSR
ncbi:MAG: tetratricopeptide repeat protein [Planctomycetes bacterium]|nr:tetratricopeptide repeat protein [Planctomycetota bacterium]MBI3833090.1 tetratricopeptide repeat protein [Planctomycetota bacterium]